MWTFLSLTEPIEPQHEGLVRAACARLPRGRRTRQKARAERETARVALREQIGLGALLVGPQAAAESRHPLLGGALDWGWTPVNAPGLPQQDVARLFDLPGLEAGEPLPLLSRGEGAGRALLCEGRLQLDDEVGLLIGDAPVSDLAVTLFPRPWRPRSRDLGRQVWLEMHELRRRPLSPRPEGGVHVLLSAGGAACAQRYGALQASASSPGFSEVTPASPGTLEIAGQPLAQRLMEWEGQDVALWLGGPPPLTPDLVGEARWVL